MSPRSASYLRPAQSRRLPTRPRGSASAAPWWSPPPAAARGSANGWSSSGRVPPACTPRRSSTFPSRSRTRPCGGARSEGRRPHCGRGGAAIGLAKIIARDLSVPIRRCRRPIRDRKRRRSGGPARASGSSPAGQWRAAAQHRVRSGSHLWIAGGGERRERAQRARPLRRRPVGAGSHPGDGCLRGRGGAALCRPSAARRRRRIGPPRAANV